MKQYFELKDSQFVAINGKPTYLKAEIKKNVNNGILFKTAIINREYQNYVIMKDYRSRKL